MSVAPRRVIRSTSATVSVERLRLRRPGEVRPPAGQQVRGRLAVGDDEDDRLGVGVLVEEAARPASARAAGWCPAPCRASRPASSVGVQHPRVRREADDLQRVLRDTGRSTSACSASAVALAAPQVSRSTIEYDRSTSRHTAADVRRSVSATSKSSVDSRMPAPRPGDPAAAAPRWSRCARRRAAARRRTATAGSRRSARRPGPRRARRGRRGPPTRRSAKTRRSAVCPSRRTAFGGELEPAARSRLR